MADKKTPPGIADNLWVLKKSERDIIREVEPKRLAKLDEDDLLALHGRVRRERTKHVKNYRRLSAKKVKDAGGRGGRNAKSRLRAEVFEEALSVVSARLAVLAHQQAEELKSERLGRVKAAKNSGPGKSSDAQGQAGKGRAVPHAKSTGGLKKDAHTRAIGRRRQARKDAR